MGFLLRLTEINAYETPYWIVKEADLRPKTFDRTCSFVSDPEVDFVPLAEMTRLKLSDLKKLVSFPAGDKYGVTVLGQTVPLYLLRLRHSRVCPKCLTQSSYYRKQWDFAAVTSCPVHLNLLLEACHVCGKKITFVRKAVSCCPCGADFREAQVEPLSEAETVVSRLVYQALGEMKPASRDCQSKNPLYRLDLLSFLEGLFLVASQREGIADFRGKYLLSRKTTREIHEYLLRAFSVFDRWPTNFHKFLNQVRAQSKSSKTNTGLKSNFGRLYRKLYSSRRVLSPSLGQVLRIGFEEYLSEHWDDGYLAKAKWFKSSNVGDRYVTKTRACRSLNLDPARLDRLVSQGKLKAVVRKNGCSRLFLVETASLRQLQQEFSLFLSAEGVSRLLGISRLNVRRLVEESLLVPVDDPPLDDRDSWKFDKVAVKGFLAKILSTTVRFEPAHPRRLRSFNDVLNVLQLKLADSGYGVHTLIEDTLSGLITPRDDSSYKPGLSRLLFSVEEFNEYVRSKRMGRRGENLRAVGKVKNLGIDPEAAYFLASKGLIRTKERTRHGERYRTPTAEAVRLFKAEYKFAIEVAHDFGTTTDFLIKALRTLNIYPLSGKSVDGGPKYVFRRADLQSLDLKQLKSLLRRKKTTSSRPTIDSAKAAKILSVEEKTIIQLVQNGVLKPYPESLDCDYLFNRTAIEKYRGQFRDLAELLSPSAAAKLFNVDVANLHVRWIRRGYLKYEISKDGKKRFFRRSDVAKIASFAAAVVTSVEAASLLGVPRHYVQRWTRAKLLIPVANPYPRAFRSFIYSRADLANLRVIDRRGSIYKKTLLRVTPAN